MKFLLLIALLAGCGDNMSAAAGGSEACSWPKATPSLHDAAAAAEAETISIVPCDDARAVCTSSAGGATVGRTGCLEAGWSCVGSCSP